MRLTMRERKAVAKVLRMRYRRASKKEKGQLLDELVGLTGYHRCYAAGVLGGQGARAEGLRGREERRARQRPRVYDEAVRSVLRQVWLIMDCICGKRLAAVLPETTAVLERHGELELETATREKLGAISAATIDRLLAAERRRLELRGRSGTKPGTLLRQQIPVRTFAEWDQTKPGFVEIDLVGHDGGFAHGDFCQSLDVTDVASGWTETQAVLNKAQVWVFEALREIRARLPFALRGIDSDNGSEFINHELLRYAQEERITFTPGSGLEEERRLLRRTEELLRGAPCGGLCALRGPGRSAPAQRALPGASLVQQLLSAGDEAAAQGALRGQGEEDLRPAAHALCAAARLERSPAAGQARAAHPIRRLEPRRAQAQHLPAATPAAQERPPPRRPGGQRDAVSW